MTSITDMDSTVRILVGAQVTCSDFMSLVKKNNSSFYNDLMEETNNGTYMGGIREMGDEIEEALGITVCVSYSGDFTKDSQNDESLWSLVAGFELKFPEECEFGPDGYYTMVKCQSNYSNVHKKAHDFFGTDHSINIFFGGTMWG